MTNDPQSRLDEIRSRRDAATPGDWQHIDCDYWENAVMRLDWFDSTPVEHRCGWPDIMDKLFIPHEDNENFEADMRFASNAHADVGFLLAEVGRLNDVVAEMEPGYMLTEIRAGRIFNEDGSRYVSPPMTVRISGVADE